MGAVFDREQHNKTTATHQKLHSVGVPYINLYLFSFVPNCETPVRLATHLLQLQVFRVPDCPVRLMGNQKKNGWLVGKRLRERKPLG